MTRGPRDGVRRRGERRSESVRYVARRGRSALLLTGALLASGSGAPQLVGQDAAAPPTADPAAVARAIIAADNARDLEAVMVLYTGDAELWPPGEPPVRGAEAIEARYREIFASVAPELRTEILGIREAQGWALIEGEVHGTVSPFGGAEPVTVDDKYLMVLERADDGAWRIARLAWSSNRAP